MKLTPAMMKQAAAYFGAQGGKIGGKATSKRNTSKANYLNQVLKKYVTWKKPESCMKKLLTIALRELDLV